MPFPLHKSPRGLLELLRLRTLGAQPSLFSEGVQPVVVVNDHYAADLLVNSNHDLAAAAFPLVQTVTTAGVTRLMTFSVDVTLGAAVGTYLALSIGLQLPSSSNPVSWYGYQLFTAGLIAGEAYRLVANMPSPLILPSGAFLIAGASSNAAGADHVLSLRTTQQVLVANA